MYLKTYCVHQCDNCQEINWIDFGDTADISGYDPEGYKCWNCGKIERFDGISLDECEQSEIFYNKGESFVEVQ